ncbi:nuclear transport factor 2 family protein [Amycolatopsis sp.]|uniref:nuclear transport factor 2 family protein n=1 Tax=Amycolatopsis sp. TaxID=37632 RepID=UPI002E05EDD8|nr:nuclear transport factor 2 family protein [Amycolatopsis sp.]
MPTPREVFERLSEGISEGRWEELSALYAEDTVVEHPQRPPVPTRIEGRAIVHEHFTGGLAQTLRMRRRNAVVHETTDPEVIVVEYDYSGEALNTGKTFETANIQVLRIRDGLIAGSRDYHDYFQFAAAGGSLAPLAEAVENTIPELAPLPERPPSTAAPDSPRGVFERLVYGVSDGKWDELPELYAPETQVSHPFLPNSATMKTRQELRDHFALAGELSIQLQARDLVVYESTDPEVVIGEFDYQGTTETGRPFRVSNIFVLRVRDGLIVESRDYGDHLSLAAASGRLKELISLLPEDRIPRP